MSDSDLITFLTDEVWPHLDGVEAGLLDGLSPKSPSSSGWYTLDCPVCHHKRCAFYRRGSFITCNRKKKCGDSTSVYQYLVGVLHFSKKDALQRCADAVGKSLPNNNKSADAGMVLQRAARNALLENPQLLGYLNSWRGFSEDYLRHLPIGYIPDVDFLYQTFKKARIPFADAQAMGLLPYPRGSDSRNNAFMFANRLVGFWKSPDGRTGLWGRSLPGFGAPERGEKYLFTSGISKSVPWLFAARTTNNVGIEGALDAAAMRALGYNAHAIGGASYIAAQIKTLADQGVTHTCHMTDGDVAGLSGGFDSVINGILGGVRVSVAPLADGLEDPDALRQAKRPDLTVTAIERQHPPGEFLALLILRARRTHQLDPDKLQGRTERVLSECPFPDVVADYHSTFRKLGQ